MSAIGKGDWVQVVHGVEGLVPLRVGEVFCVEAVDTAQPGLEVFCTFDGCMDGGLALVSKKLPPNCFFCANRFKPLGGNGVAVERRELADA